MTTRITSEMLMLHGREHPTEGSVIKVFGRFLYIHSVVIKNNTETISYWPVSRWKWIRYFQIRLLKKQKTKK